MQGLEVTGPDVQENDMNAPTWCKCGICIELQKDEENKCCGKRKCITSCQVFHEAILNRNVLEIAMKTRYDMYVETFEFTTNEWKTRDRKGCCSVRGL